jgi:hypothetical protein
VAWLGLIPYGLWSKAIAEPSLDEYRHRVQIVADDLISLALAQFDLQLAKPHSLTDLASAFVTLVEGHWLNACLSPKDPVNQTRSLEAALATALKMLFAGAVQKRKAGTARRVVRGRGRSR